MSQDTGILCIEWKDKDCQRPLRAGAGSENQVFFPACSPLDPVGFMQWTCKETTGYVGVHQSLKLLLYIIGNITWGNRKGH